MIDQKKKLVLFMVMSLCFLMIFAASVYAETPKEGGVLRLAINRDIVGFEPHTYEGTMSNVVHDQVYDPLLDYDEEGNLTSGLAESWEIGEDSKTYTFYLREDVVFHNGDEFSAEDVIYSYNRIMNDEEVSATRRGDFNDLIESIDAIDDYTVVIELKDPYAPFLHILAATDTSIVSKNWAENDGDFQEWMMGTGPFILEDFEIGLDYIFDKNPDYWGEGPYIDQLVILPIEDLRARIGALLTGDVHIAEYLAWEHTHEIEMLDTVDYYLDHVAINFARFQTETPPVDDPLVRQALNYALDREEINELAYGGMGLPMKALFLHPDNPYYSEEVESFYEYNPEKALELLEEAGYEDPSEVEFLFHSYKEPHHLRAGEVMVQQWRDFGINVTDIELMEVSVLVENRTSGDFTVMVDGIGFPTTDPSLYNPWFMTDGHDYARGGSYSNPQVDELLEKGAVLTEFDERKVVYEELEMTVLSDAPIATAVWRPQIEGISIKLRGYDRPGGLGPESPVYMDLHKVWFEE